MSNFSNIKIERKNILDLLILVTAITMLANFFTNFASWGINSDIIKNQHFLNIQANVWLWFWLIFFFIIIGLWRALKSPLFSFKLRKRLPLIFIYDKKNKNLLGINDYRTPYYNAYYGFQELLKVDKNFKDSLPSMDDKGIGSDGFRDTLQGIFEYGMLATIGYLFWGGYKIENEQSAFGITTYDSARDGVKITFNDLPAKLRDGNIILETFKDNFQNKKNGGGLTWLDFSLPPKISLTYENKKLFYKNNYIEFIIDFSGRGGMTGVPINLLSNASEENDRFITLIFDPIISVKIIPYLALSPKSEFYADWSAQYIERLENLMITDEREYSDKIKKDNPDVIF